MRELSNLYLGNKGTRLHIDNNNTNKEREVWIRENSQNNVCSCVQEYVGANLTCGMLTSSESDQYELPPRCSCPSENIQRWVKTVNIFSYIYKRNNYWKEMFLFTLTLSSLNSDQLSLSDKLSHNKIPENSNLKYRRTAEFLWCRIVTPVPIFLRNFRRFTRIFRAH